VAICERKLSDLNGDFVNLREDADQGLERLIDVYEEYCFVSKDAVDLNENGVVVDVDADSDVVRGAIWIRLRNSFVEAE
jgi:hypothetical protein